MFLDFSNITDAYSITPNTASPLTSSQLGYREKKINKFRVWQKQNSPERDCQLSLERYSLSNLIYKNCLK